MYRKCQKVMFHYFPIHKKCKKITIYAPFESIILLKFLCRISVFFVVGLSWSGGKKENKLQSSNPHHTLTLWALNSLRCTYLIPSIIDSEKLHIDPFDQSADLPHKVKTQFVHFRLHANYFLLPRKIPQEISTLSMLINN